MHETSVEMQNDAREEVSRCESYIVSPHLTDGYARQQPVRTPQLK